MDGELKPNQAPNQFPMIMAFSCDDVTMRDDKKKYRHRHKAFNMRGLVGVRDDVTIKSHTYPYREKESTPKKGIIFRWKLVAEFIVTFVRIIPFLRGKSPFHP